MSNTLGKKMERKIRKVGNSLSVTLPKEVLEFADLKEGDTVEFSDKNGKLVIEKKNSIVTPEFMDLIENVYQEQKEVFDKLIER
ncbi:AbrB/MazE/SpoVT family DNA-binding domain-containing protein [Alkalibacterium sp. MB6]|uniref:AbrB/MazE/SpoVT family DNA-binding domain-containing protein n=1 Tax=Alkalibacterium sp. MB6 TaxID=2081965 RepID=UPI00192A2B43|nr:AbrB/MazE/SpoVT family DNA-binding domain-containing protein [Alkalibacterium sp. MB6]